MSKISIEVSDEIIDMVRQARYYKGDESFILHCGYKMVELVSEEMGWRDE